MPIVAVVGSGHLACVYAACITELGHEVRQTDVNEKVIGSLLNGQAPIFENGLNDLIKKGVASGKLTFLTDLKLSLTGAEIVYIADDIPLTQSLPNVGQFLHRVRSILPLISDDVVIVTSTQLPVGTCNETLEWVEKKYPLRSVKFVYQPEFLRLGAAVDRFISPDSIVLGHNSEVAANLVKNLYDRVDCPKLMMGLKDAEMVKHAANAYVANSVSFASELGRLSDHLGVNAFNVGNALKKDKRIGSHAYVLPGLGFTGGNLERDIRVLKDNADKFGVEMKLLDAVLQVNEVQAHVPFERIKRMLRDPKGKTVGVFGLSYKSGSSSIRGSYGVSLVKALQEIGVATRLYDPDARDSEIQSVLGSKLIADPYEAACGCNMIAFMKNEQRFGELDLDRLHDQLSEKQVFDAYGVLQEGDVTKSGIAYATIGRGFHLKLPDIMG